MTHIFIYISLCTPQCQKRKIIQITSETTANTFKFLEDLLQRNRKNKQTEIEIEQPYSA